MTEEIYNDIAAEAMMKERFGIQADIKTMIARSIPTSRTTEASVFLTTKNQVYVLITGRAPMTLGDIRKMIRRMGMVADAYVPPKHDPEYFDRVATAKFREVFPGRKAAGDADLRFYRLLAPYNPALVRIAEITDGVVRQFDSVDRDNWRVAAKYAYRRIRTK